MFEFWSLNIICNLELVIWYLFFSSTYRNLHTYNHLHGCTCFYPCCHPFLFPSHSIRRLWKLFPIKLRLLLTRPSIKHQNPKRFLCPSWPRKTKYQQPRPIPLITCPPCGEDIYNFRAYVLNFQLIV